MSAKEAKCPFCGQQIQIADAFFPGDIRCKCPNCGAYETDMGTLLSLEATIAKDPTCPPWIYSGAIREMHEKRVSFPKITKEHITDFRGYVSIPSKPSEKLAKLLLYVYRRTSYLSEGVPIPNSMLSVAYAKHVEELRSLLGALDELGYLKGPEVLGSQDYSLTLSGFSEAERMAAVTESDQCFVALWFDDKMRDVFNTSITAAAEKCGYKAMIIPMKEHNDDITDHIIAEIRRSRFIIADFTGLRGGVYYEAGFAAGLGKPVIYTCRKDWFNTTVKVTTQVEGSDGPVQVKMDEQRFVHFDLSQMNFIVWETGEALEARLIDRIAATIV